MTQRPRFRACDSVALEALSQAMQRRCETTERTSRSEWRVPQPGKTSECVSVRLADDWLHFETPLPCRRADDLPGPRRASGLLCGNVHLPEGMNYCVSAQSRGTYLIADVALHDEYDDAEQMLAEVQVLFDTFCEALQASPQQRVAEGADAVDQLHQPLTVDDTLGETTRALCTSMGWPYSERGDGQLAITLDVPGQFCQASAYLVGDGEYRLATTLETPSEASATSRHAIATFLLTASRMVRMVRAVVVPDSRRGEYRWEVAWPQMPPASQFHCGLSALSIACRLTQRELLALCDESIANKYLELRRRWSQ